MVLEVPSKIIRQEKEIKATHIRKKEAKLSLFTDDTVLHVEHSKDFTPTTKKTVTINKFSKLQDIKSTHKNQLCFYTLKTNNPKRKPFHLQ